MILEESQIVLFILKWYLSNGGGSTGDDDDFILHIFGGIIGVVKPFAEANET